MRTSSIPFSAGGVVWALVFILIGFRLGPLTRQALERSRPLTAIDKLVATRLVSPREAAVSPQGPAAVALDWARIHSTNYPTYLRNLREIGCPSRTLRNILLADINASFDARKALRPSDPGYLAPEALERERQHDSQDDEIDAMWPPRLLVFTRVPDCLARRHSSGGFR